MRGDRPRPDAFAAHRASAHFGTWLSGQVLPALAERTRLDLVPMTRQPEW
jgi:hypothetical protein